MDSIAIIDFGGQYTHLIANRIRRLGVFSEIVKNTMSASRLSSYKGIILSGSPFSVLEEKSPGIDPDVLTRGIPLLGLCYGHQLLAKYLGGKVVKGKYSEYGIAHMRVLSKNTLFAGLEDTEQIWMSHGDAVESLPQGFEIIASTPKCTITAMGNPAAKMFGLQFHPEVTDTPHGMKILDNFITVCGCRRDWNPREFQKALTQDIRSKCSGRKVFLLVSGGVDSTVAFTLLNTILGPQRVMGLHIDNGLMRHEESAAIVEYMKAHGFDNLRIVNATDRFITALNGVADPEEKRRIIGSVFLEVKEQALEDFGLNPAEWILGQGTIYPDTIESAGTQHSDRIKTHHNRVAAIVELLEKGEIVEPLAQLYKDEVRELGKAIGIPDKLLWRHPFPGPGLGVRLLCSNGKTISVAETTRTSVEAIAVKAGYESQVLPLRSVGVQGDSRTYAHPVLVCGEKNWQRLEVLSTTVTNSVRDVNRVVYGLRVEDDPHYRLIEAYVDANRLEMLRAIDHIVTEALLRFGEYASVWQMPVVLLPIVNKQGGQCCVLRPIMSQEAMTARFA
ncbi:MAG TPA: glutamine-hydrolyzing GMP synthase, partial [Chitinivibrionales bacterium]